MDPEPCHLLHSWGSEMPEFVHKSASKLPFCLPRVRWLCCDALLSVICLFLNKSGGKKSTFLVLYDSNFDMESLSLHDISCRLVPLTWKWNKSLAVAALCETLSEPEYAWCSCCCGAWIPQTPLPQALTAAACLDMGWRSVVYFGALCSLKWPTTMSDLLVPSSFFVQQ